MNPRIAALSGSIQGSIWQVQEASFSIGRGASNQVVLNDSEISRRHCTIVIENGTFKLTDNESLNGTFVNNHPVKERILHHGDRIDVGDFAFVFLLEEDDSNLFVAGPVEADARALISKSTSKIRREDVLFLKPDSLAAALPASRIATDLSFLLNISGEILSARTSGTLFARVLEIVFDSFPVEHGAALVMSAEGGFDVACARDRTSGTGGKVHVLTAAVQEASAQKATLLIGEPSVPEDAPYKANAILCAPMVSDQVIIGMIYLDLTDPDSYFDDNHLQLAATIAGFLSLAYENLRKQEWLEAENQRLSLEIHPVQGMIGESPSMKELFRIVARAATTDSTVLITGESGTGKELIAQAIHAASPRSAGPFVAINCATLTDSLLESELFGHEKGAFTGAIAQIKGKLEVAHTGAVFLDEVAELTPSLQAKLLRVLQERQFERIGGRRPINVDIRLIAATNRDLKEAVKSGNFREDFFYRLNVLHLAAPPLRDRKEDIPLLANHFVRKYSAKFQRRVSGISPEARAYLMHYDWPGNVRELENAIERAVVLGSTDLLLAEDLPDSLLETQAPSGILTAHYHEAMQDAKRKIIQQALDQEGGSVAAAARLLGLQRTYLHRVMRNLQMKSDEKP